MKREINGKDSHQREIRGPALPGKGLAVVRALCEGTHPVRRRKSVAEDVRQIQIEIQIQMFHPVIQSKSVAAVVDQIAMQR